MLPLPMEDHGEFEERLEEVKTVDKRDIIDHIRDLQRFILDFLKAAIPKLPSGEQNQIASYVKKTEKPEKKAKYSLNLVSFQITN